MSKIQPSNQNAALDISSDHKAEKLKFQPAHNVGDSTPCDICKLILEDLEQNLAANSTEQEIEQFLMQACDVFPDNSQAFVSFFYTYTFTNCLKFLRYSS